MKKRFISIVMLLVLVCISVFGGVTSDNRQKIYPIDSDIYEAIKYLYISEGLALPSTTGPWSAGELDLMLSRIDSTSLSDSEMYTYQFILDELNAEARFNPDSNFGLGIGLDANVAMFMHSNANDFVEFDDFGGTGDWRAPLPMLSIPFETWIGDNVYGFTQLDVGINRSLTNGLKGANFASNIIMVPPVAAADFNLNFPLRAVGAIGGESWNIAVGREKMKWGPGETGNLVIGDQINYHNNARLTAFSDHFKYTLSVSSFTHPKNYTSPGDDGKDYLRFSSPDSLHPGYAQTEDKDGLRMFISHRIEWRIINKLNMALTESIMYDSATNHLDLLVLSPTAIFHNYYIRGNANSLLSLELDYTPIKNLNIYGELAIDEIKGPGEFTGKGPASAFGLILGAKTSIPYRDGMFYGYLEGAYTDPYLYLRDDGKSFGPDKYGINFVVAMQEFGNRGSNYTLDFLGYRYGNDNIVASLNGGYKVFGKWFAEGTYTFIADGCFDMNTRWSEVTPGTDEDPSAPSDKHPAQGSFHPYDNWKDRNAVAFWNILSLKGGITLIDNLDLFGEMNFMYISNFNNIKGVDSNDFQVRLGLSYHI